MNLLSNGSAITNITELNNVSPLFTYDEDKGFYTEWPQPNMQRVDALFAGINCPELYKTKPQFDQTLNSLCASFNELLPLEDTGDSYGKLVQLAQKVEEFEQQLFAQKSELHFSLPYFDQVFSLHFAMIQGMQILRECEDHLEAAVSLTYKSLERLDKASSCAYEHRYSAVKVMRCGPNSQFAYVQDNAKEKALTTLMPYNENLEKLNTIKEHFASQEALCYVENIDFSIAQCVVDSTIEFLEKTDEEEVLVSSLKMHNRMVDTWQTEQLRHSENEHIATYEAPWEAGEKTSFDYVKEYYKTVAIGLIGDLPIPGAAAISAVTGLFVGWIFDDREQQIQRWKTYANQINQYIDQKVTDVELKSIENELIAAEEEFDQISRYLDNNPNQWGPGIDFPNQEIRTRFINLINNIKITKQRVFNPNCAMHASFPYFDRLFTLYGSIMGSATVSLETYNTYEEFQNFFEQSREYLDNAMHSAINYRTGKLDGHYNGCTNVSRMYDYQLGDESTYSDKRPLHGYDNRWDGYKALQRYLDIELGYVYPNRLKILAGLQNFDKFVVKYNEFWHLHNDNHQDIMPLTGEWISKMESQRGVANGQREMIDNGYQAWGNGPAVYNDLYFHEHIYASHFQGPRFYHSGQDEHMYLALQDYPALSRKVENTGETEVIVPIDRFTNVDFSPCYKIVVFSEENFEGNSYTFSSGNGYFRYPPLSDCGFDIKSLKIQYTRGH